MGNSMVKSSALHTRIFRNLCSEMDTSYQSLLFYTEVRWLTKGNALKRICDMKEEITTFLQNQKKEQWHSSLKIKSDMYPFYI